MVYAANTSDPAVRRSSSAFQGDTRLARYQQLADHLRTQIAANEFSPGERLPSEAELARQHDVALGTVRQAVAVLTEEGLVERRQGRGTFVAKPDFSASLARFFRVVGEDGRTVIPTGRVRRARLLRAPAEAREALGLGEDGHAVYVERARVIGERTVLLEDIWLEMGRFGELAQRPPEQFDDLLYPMLERECGVVVAHAHETFFVDRATAAHAALGVAPGDAIVVIDRVASGFDQVPVEWRRSVGNAETFRYRVELR